MDNVNTIQILLLIGAGLVAGFINTLAGSGSLLTLPVLMFLGLSPTMANGTNRIAIFMGALVSTSQFKHKGTFNYSESKFYAIPAIIGAIVGAFIAVDINEKIMELFITSMLVIMFFIVLLKPDKWIKRQVGEVLPKPNVLQIFIFFVIGVYGGLIQAGVGFFLMAGLVLGAGADLIKTNAVKVFIVLVYTPLALLIFVFNEEVYFVYGLILSIGNMGGAFIGARVSHTPKAQVITRYVLLLALLMAIAKLVYTSF